MADTFTVIYRSGGPKMATWRRTSVDGTKEEAVAKHTEIERMGYKALIKSTRELDSIGLPIGWDAETPINYEEDEIHYSKFETRHIPA